MPTPMPGPIAARPYPTAPMLPVTAVLEARMSTIIGCLLLEEGHVWRSRGRTDDANALMLVGEGSGDICRREDREDVGLQGLDQQFEEGEEDRHRERHRGENR